MEGYLKLRLQSLKRKSSNIRQRVSVETNFDKKNGNSGNHKLLKTNRTFMVQFLIYAA